MNHLKDHVREVYPTIDHFLTYGAHETGGVADSRSRQLRRYVALALPLLTSHSATSGSRASRASARR